MTNKLLKRLGELKREKAELATQVEQEEEFLSNTLGRKLEAARKEKASRGVGRARRRPSQLLPALPSGGRRAHLRSFPCAAPLSCIPASPASRDADMRLPPSLAPFSPNLFTLG